MDTGLYGYRALWILGFINTGLYSKSLVARVGMPAGVLFSQKNTFCSKTANKLRKNIGR